MGFLKSRLFRFIASLGLAALFFFLCPPCFSKVYLGIVLALLVIIINANRFFGQFRWLTHIARFLVGGLFIFSGFIKANDPVGFGIKLDEYFEVFEQGFSCDMQLHQESVKGVPCNKPVEQPQLTPLQEKVKALLEAKQAEARKSTFLFKMWEFFREHSLPLAIIICGFEMVLGLFLLLGVQVRWTLLLLLAMIVFFAFLTFYSACCNKVTSCGCFGDAIKLTPWESFWKDLYLLLLISVIFVGEQNVKPLFKNRIVLAGVAAIGLFASFAFPVYTYRHLPIIDFRPYKIGTNLWEASQNKDPKETGCKKDSMIITYYYQNQRTGEMVHFRYEHIKDSFPTDTLFKIYCRDDKLVYKGNCGATVLDFNLNDPETGETLNDSLLHNYKGIQFFLVMEDIAKADTADFRKVNAFYEECRSVKNNMPFNALSSASYDQAKAFREATGAKFPMLQVDQTALKTVIRSNPGLVMLKDGVVTAMWHYNDFPEFKDVMEKYK
jgi:uncharacterized membrane protein YphA (DoxX/SURF4 family)